MFRTFNPPVFQGNLKKDKYFEGWYFKQVSRNLDQVYAFIPGISLTKNEQHAFIQMINGITGTTEYFNYDLQDFSYKKDRFYVRVGDSEFSKDGIRLNIKQKDRNIQGKVEFNNTSPYPSSLLAPGIMGWYSFIPFMECYHGVVSANHGLQGEFTLDGRKVNMTGGKGYIEKDWGRSFPECWMWVQSNSFEHFDQSFFLSVAKIPWLGNYFIGFIAFVYRDGKYIRFSSYNRSRITHLKQEGQKFHVGLDNRHYELELNIIAHQAGDLVAPVKGKMDRMIKESIDAELSFQLRNKKTGEVLTDQSPRAGLEIIEGILDYF